ncbi:39S ribosomal protein L54, mitochondrial-like [Mercenaria mercenaria]|uniref:39S ribosomal protein L54, mitochondrial-like n=1 Tax=Mercenaria mercenaria TaxID=6596 RepID=UPI00234E87C9|nr:39S ribosomal protein L54, mitochondrial-like [Mercenaria mercenaria]
MSCKILQRLVKTNISNTLLTYSCCRTLKLQSVVHAKKGVGAAPAKKKQFDVETDPKVLCTRLCGGNIYKEGEDPVLGPDEEYPEWLWELRLEKTAIPLEELSEDDPRYWRRLKKLTLRQNNAKRYVKKL